MTKQALFVAAIVAGFAVTGCKKDKTPSNSEKLSGTWDVQELQIGGEVLLPYPGADDVVPSMTYVFDADGDFNQNISIDYTTEPAYSYSYDFPGDWTASDTELDLDFATNSSSAIEFEASWINYYAENYYQYNEKYQIIELTEAGSMQLSSTINGKLVTIKATKR